MPSDDYDFGRLAPGVPFIAKGITEIKATLERIEGMLAWPPVHEEKARKAVPLADWDDPRVQAAYEVLCDDPYPINPEEHWEGYQARAIVAAIDALVSGKVPHV